MKIGAKSQPRRVAGEVKPEAPRTAQKAERAHAQGKAKPATTPDLPPNLDAQIGAGMVASSGTHHPNSMLSARLGATLLPTGTSTKAHPEVSKALNASALEALQSVDTATLQVIAEQAFGAQKAARLVDLVQDGNIPLPEDVRFVDRELLTGADGGYITESQTVLLAADLQNDDAFMRDVFLEEFAHHLDKTLGGTDAAGDEGEILATALADGEPLGADELAAARADRDSSAIVLDGERVEMENAIFFAIPIAKILIATAARIAAQNAVRYSARVLAQRGLLAPIQAAQATVQRMALNLPSFSSRAISQMKPQSRAIARRINNGIADLKAKNASHVRGAVGDARGLDTTANHAQSYVQTMKTLRGQLKELKQVARQTGDAAARQEGTRISHAIQRLANEVNRQSRPGPPHIP